MAIITFPWTRGTEAQRAANSSVPAAGMLAVTNEGNVYAADGSTAWNAAQRLAKPADITAKTANLKRNLKSDFGAIGNGTTDDTAAVQAWVTYCVTNGVSGYAPAGTYKLTASINFSFRPGWDLQGAGTYNTKFIQYADNVPIFVLGSDTASLMHRFSICDMAFGYNNSQSGNTAANCIQFAQASSTGAFQGTFRNLDFMSGYYGIAVTAGMGGPWGQTWDDLKFENGLYGGAIDMSTATFAVPNNHFGRMFVDASNMVGPVFSIRGYNFVIDTIEIIAANRGPQLLQLAAGANLTIGAFKVENGTWTVNRDLIDIAPNAKLRVGELSIDGTSGMTLNIPGGSGVLYAFALGAGSSLDLRDATVNFQTVTAGSAYLIKSGSTGKVTIGAWRSTAATFALQNAGGSSSSDNITVQNIANTHISYDKGDADYTVADGDPTTILFNTALTAPRVVNLQNTINNLFNGMRYRIVSLGAVNGANTITIKQGTTTLGTLTSDLTSIEFASRRVPFGTSWFLLSRTDISGATATAYAPNVQVFTASGTYTKPTWATTVRVVGVGVGGSGGSGRQGLAGTVRCGGGAGAGGGKHDIVLAASDVTTTVAVTIGTPGTPGAAQATASTDGVAGATGSQSTFGTYLRLVPGGSGGGGTASAGTAGAAVGAMFAGTAGAAASTTGLAGGNGSSANVAGSGGGAGGGIQATNVANAGGSAFQNNELPGSGVSGGGANTGANGTAGVARIAGEALGGNGGGGGGANLTGTGGNGGAGGLYGGGGGGGGASVDGFASGAGGAGGPSIIVVIST